MRSIGRDEPSAPAKEKPTGRTMIRGLLYFLAGGGTAEANGGGCLMKTPEWNCVFSKAFSVPLAP
jgi:hypothetical protein